MCLFSVRWDTVTRCRRSRVSKRARWVDLSVPPAHCPLSSPALWWPAACAAETLREGGNGSTMGGTGGRARMSVLRGLDCRGWSCVALHRPTLCGFHHSVQVRCAWTLQAAPERPCSEVNWERGLHAHGWKAQAPRTPSVLCAHDLDPWFLIQALPLSRYVT